MPTALGRSAVAVGGAQASRCDCPARRSPRPYSGRRSRMAGDGRVRCARPALDTSLHGRFAAAAATSAAARACDGGVYTPCKPRVGMPVDNVCVTNRPRDRHCGASQHLPCARAVRNARVPRRARAHHDVDATGLRCRASTLVATVPARAPTVLERRTITAVCNNAFSARPGVVGTRRIRNRASRPRRRGSRVRPASAHARTHRSRR